MNQVSRLTTFSKLLIAIAIIGVLYGAYRLALLKGFIPQSGQKIERSLPEGVSKETPLFNIGVVTWGGYAGGQYFNGGFKASQNSRYYKEYKILVNFIIIDDFVNSREAFKSGDIDLLWVTADAFPTEAGNLPDEPVFLFQADWSRGGDAIVVQRGINTVNDLAGKKVAVAFGTPSHSFLIWMLKAGGLSYNDIKIVEVPNAIDAASTFKSGAVDAAVVWSPDDKDCIDKVPGSRILKSTKEASHIIADGFLVKRKFLEKNKQALKSLVTGWLTGAAEINQNPEAKEKAIKILAEGLNISEDLARNSINNVRLTTLGDNHDFFGLSRDYKGIKGEDLYDSMTVEYTNIGLVKGKVPFFRQLTDLAFIRSIHLTGEMHAAEGRFKFTAPTEDLTTAKPSAVKKVVISFAPYSTELDDNAKRVIDLEIGPIAKRFAHNRIRIEGHAAKTRDFTREKDIAFSKKRAEAVARYLLQQYGFDKNQFIMVGLGHDQPLVPHDSPEALQKNRRTEFMILE